MERVQLIINTFTELLKLERHRSVLSLVMLLMLYLFVFV